MLTDFDKEKLLNGTENQKNEYLRYQNYQTSGPKLPISPIAAALITNSTSRKSSFREVNVDEVEEDKSLFQKQYTFNRQNT